MRDTCRHYVAIQQGLLQFYQLRPTGHRQRHLNTLVALIYGLTGGQRAHLSTIAEHASNGGVDQESVMTRFRRWLTQHAHTCAGYHERRSCRWAIARSDSAMLIGTCGFYGWDPDCALAELGYDLARAYWGAGS